MYVYACVCVYSLGYCLRCRKWLSGVSFQDASGKKVGGRAVRGIWPFGGAELAAVRSFLALDSPRVVP